MLHRSSFRPLTWSMLAAVISALLALPLAADQRNAATWYEKAFTVLERMNTEEFAALEAYRSNPIGPPSPLVREALIKVQTAMDYGARGARQPYADYGLDYGLGFDLELPHLQQSRQLAKIMEADSYVRLHDQDFAGAAERIAAIYGVAHHAGDDRVVISSMVGQSVWANADQALQRAMDQGALSSDNAALLLHAASAFPQKDPFNYVEAAVSEGDMAIATVERYFAEDDGLSGLGAIFSDGQVPPELAMMSREDLDQDLEKYSLLMNDIVEAFADDDTAAGREALARMEKQLVDGEYGMLAKLLCPAYTKIYEKKIEGERKLAERLAMLEKLAAGEIEPLEEANAAVWYLNAIERLNSWDQKKLDALRRAEPGDAGANDEALTALLKDSEGMFDLLRQASAIRRCDFSLARETPASGPVVIAPYTPGMHDLIQLVLIDASLRLPSQPAECRDRLSIGWSMLNHFEDDPIAPSSIMCQNAFDRLVDLSCEAISGGVFDGEQHAALHELASRLGRKDPFGLLASTVQARHDLAGGLTRLVPRDAPERMTILEEMKQTVEQLDGDRVLDLGVVLDTMAYAPDADQSRRRTYELLADVYDPRAVEHTRNEVSSIAPTLVGHQFEALLTLTMPSVGSIGERTQRARGQLRRGLERLRPSTAPTPQEQPVATAPDR